MKLNNILNNRYYLLILGVMAFSHTVNATGPRVTPSLFTSDVSEIYAVDYPPFISTEIAGGGLHTEIIDAVAEAEGLKIAVTTVPLARMAKYYLQQENALAVVGDSLGLQREQESLIAIPISLSSNRYLYYAPTPKTAVVRKGEFSDMRGLVYGAQKSEDVTRYKKAGAKIVYGTTRTLMKKLVTGKVDLIRAPRLTIEWMIERYHSDKKAQFFAVKKGSDERVHYLLFNKKNGAAAEISKRFRQGLKGLLSSGKYQRIVQKSGFSKDEQMSAVTRLKVLLE